MIQKAETSKFRMAGFGLRCRYFAWVTVLVVLVETACYVDTARPRVVFPTEEAAERYFAEHRDEFSNLAIAWLASGHSQLAVIDREWFVWNECRVSPNFWWFEVMRWNGHEYVVQRVRTVNEAALKCGTTRQEILKWQERLALVRVGEITHQRAVKGTKRFSYVELGFLESTQPYGFRYAPRGDPVAQRELTGLAAGPMLGSVSRDCRQRTAGQSKSLPRPTHRPNQPARAHPIA